MKSDPGYLDPETLVENCAPKFSIEKAVPYKPLPEEEGPAAPSGGSAANQAEEEEYEEYSYSDQDYSHLYKKLASTADDHLEENLGVGKYTIC